MTSRPKGNRRSRPFPREYRFILIILKPFRPINLNLCVKQRVFFVRSDVISYILVVEEAKSGFYRRLRPRRTRVGGLPTQMIRSIYGGETGRVNPALCAWERLQYETEKEKAKQSLYVDPNPLAIFAHKPGQALSDFKLSGL